MESRLTASFILREKIFIFYIDSAAIREPYGTNKKPARRRAFYIVQYKLQNVILRR
jgi:hypothetical protein